MRVMKSLLLVFALVVVAAAQSPEPPLAEPRLTVHTLLREDIFAGWMAKDMVRFERGERNIEQLMRDRPDQQLLVHQSPWMRSSRCDSDMLTTRGKIVWKLTIYSGQAVSTSIGMRLMPLMKFDRSRSTGPARAVDEGRCGWNSSNERSTATGRRSNVSRPASAIG